MLVIGDEARLVLAFRKAREAGNGLDVAALEVLALLLGEKSSPAMLTAGSFGENFSPRCSDPLMTSSDA